MKRTVDQRSCVLRQQFIATSRHTFCNNKTTTPHFPIALCLLVAYPIIIFCLLVSYFFQHSLPLFSLVFHNLQIFCSQFKYALDFYVTVLRKKKLIKLRQTFDGEGQAKDEFLQNLAQRLFFLHTQKAKNNKIA